MQPLSSRIIFSFLAVALPIGAHVADMMAPTHIYNTRWPPHAKFHCGQTLAMSVMLGLLTLSVACRRSSDVISSAWTAFALAVTYHVTQAAAILYPGTAFFDPEFTPIEPLGAPIQLWFGVLQIALASCALRISMRSRPPAAPE